MSKKVFCEVCAAFIPSATLVDAHNKGKKHQRLLKVQEQKERAGKRSVYVRNFEASPTIEEDLKQYFGCYGDVKNVFLDKEEGVYAIVEFELEESVAKVLGEQDLPPLKGRKLRVKARTVPKKHNASSPPNLTGGQPHPKGEQLLAPFLGEELITKIRSGSVISEQVSILMEGLRLQEDDLRLRQLICDLLQEVFKEAYPYVQVVPFGSTVTGLGWRGSDLDVCLITDASKDGISLSDRPTSESPSAGEGANQDYSFIIDVLRRLVPGCTRVIPVLSAKCPLIRFTHQPSGLACDLTINNRLGICNSELLQCYMSLDVRVKLLVFAVRGWAKAKGVREKCQLSNYALTMMVLYFLQTTTPTVIPSLQEPGEWFKLHGCNKSATVAGENDQSQFTEKVIDGWSCSYLSDVKDLPHSRNVKTLDQLLEEFFNFYGSEFDYGNCVVNIRRGKRTTADQVIQELPNSTTPSLADEQSSSQPPEVEKKSLEFKVTPLCVQDPFELTHNVAQSVSAMALKQFIHLAMEGRTVCKNSLTQKNHKGSLLKLLSVPKRMKKKKPPSYSFFVPLPSQEEGLDVDNGSVMNAGGVFCTVLQILQDKFGLVCEVNSSVDMGSTVQRMENSESVQIPYQVCEKQENKQSSNSSMSYLKTDKDAVVETSKCGAKRKADETESAMENPAKKVRCDKGAEKHEATCTAWKNTWRSHRKEKRQQKNEGSTLEDSSVQRETIIATHDEPADLTSRSSKDECSQGTHASSSPVIVFKLTVSACKEEPHRCTIYIEGVFSSDKLVLGNFFGVFKQHVLSHLV